MAASLKSKFDESTEIKAGKSGQFDVIVDGRLVFSKAQTGRFPVDDEVESMVAALKNGEEPPPAPPKPPGFVERMLDRLRN